MPKPLFFVFLILLSSKLIFAQAFNLTAHQNALGNIKAAALDKASYGNPSSNVFYEGLSFFAGVENRFVGTDIRGFALGASYTLDQMGSFQVGINRLGIEGLYLQELSFGYARKLGKKAAIGGNLLVFSRQADRYENHQSISFNIGTQFALSENVQAGILISNPLPDRKENPSFNFNSEIAVGVAWRLTKLTTYFEIAKPQQTKYEIKTGIDYRPVTAISILGGVSLAEQDLRPSLGLTYRLKGLALTVSGAFYNQLAPGMSIGLVYAPSNSE